MGESASTWRTPLHSSGTEAPDPCPSEGKGEAFVIARAQDAGKMPGTAGGDPTAGIQTTSTQDHNPWRKV